MKCLTNEEASKLYDVIIGPISRGKNAAHWVGIGTVAIGLVNRRLVSIRPYTYVHSKFGIKTAFRLEITALGRIALSCYESTNFAIAV